MLLAFYKDNDIFLKVHDKLEDVQVLSNLPIPETWRSKLKSKSKDWTIKEAIKTHLKANSTEFNLENLHICVY